MADPIRVLVIDDEPDICELLSLTLGRMDIHTETAADVASAKALLGTKQFDLCLTDMRLPDSQRPGGGSIFRIVFADPERWETGS